MQQAGYINFISNKVLQIIQMMFWLSTRQENG